MTMEEYSEIKLLLCCARVQMDATTAAQIPALLQAGIDWDLLLQIAVQHGVAPLLYWSVKSACPDAVPPAVLQRLQRLFHINAQQNLLLTQELLRLLSLFEAEQIPVLPFKGPILALTVYQNLSLRQITDLDLLVDKSHRSQAIELLMAQDYEPRIEVPWETHLIRANGLYNIDLHSTLAPKHLSYPLQNREVWQHLESGWLGGKPVKMLTPEMDLLMLCLHGTKEGWHHLNRICDVAELVRTKPLNWQLLQQQTEQWGMRRLISLGLLLAHDLLQVSLPQPAAEWIARDRTMGCLARSVKQTLFSPATGQIGEVERSLFHIRTRERFQDQFWSWWGLMEHSGWIKPTAEDQAFVPLPPALSSLYYLIRPFRVLRKYGTTLLR
nr:MAG: hypothetical protein EDM05_04025 [Leptolyngbya sp. IPPAS B-1204]